MADHKNMRYFFESPASRSSLGTDAKGAVQPMTARPWRAAVSSVQSRTISRVMMPAVTPTARPVRRASWRSS
jgi:hypothetical protein